jgi:hypothetical protein
MTNLTVILTLQKIQMRFMVLDHALDLANLTKEEAETMVDPKVAALITQFDTATNNIAARIQRLINGGTLSAESAAALQAEVDKLTVLGQDPANPVPPAAAVA